jgi:alpha-galactosidase
MMTTSGDWPPHRFFALNPLPHAKSRLPESDMNTRFASARRQYLGIVILALAAIARPERADAVAQTPEEIDAARGFTAEKLMSAGAANLPFSFVYAGKPSGELLKTWQRNAKSEDLDANRRRTNVEYFDPKTGLQVRCKAIEYHDFPTVEWTLYFKNTGAADTPILEKVLSLDTAWQRSGDREFLLHHAVGSPANRSDYGPVTRSASQGWLS